MSALVAKCQVVEDSETPASAATRAVRDGRDALARDDADGRGDDRVADAL